MRDLTGKDQSDAVSLAYGRSSVERDHPVVIVTPVRSVISFYEREADNTVSSDRERSKVHPSFPPALNLRPVESIPA